MAKYVITGCASGIGAATRARLEAAGHTVIGVDLRDAEIVADLSNAEGRAAALAAAKEACAGTLDGLVPCAGVSHPMPADAILQINWFGSETFLTGLREELAAADDVSRVVAICSNSTNITPNVPDAALEALLAMDGDAASAALEGDDVTRGSHAYAASKIAIGRYVRRNAPAAEWAGSGIRLNAIAPGPVMTPLLQATIDDPATGPMLEALPMPTGEYGTAEQMATWIEFLLSPAADFMVGSIVWVDGGIDAMIRPDDWPSIFRI